METFHELHLIACLLANLTQAMEKLGEAIACIQVLKDRPSLSPLYVGV